MSFSMKCLDQLSCVLQKQNTNSSQTLLFDRTWMSVLLLLVLLLVVEPAFAAQASEETIEVFKAAIEAFKAIEHPLTGRGSAISDMYHVHPVLNSGKKTFDFMFKGDLSRSTKFSMKEEKRDQPEVVWIVGDKCSVTRYYSGGTSVQSYPQGQFYHKLGYDFNPSTFMLSYSTPLAEHTERVLDGPATLSTKMDSNGILHLITDYKDKDSYQHYVISVDPDMGYRLVGHVGIMERFDKPDRSHTDFLEIQWEKYESSRYVKTAQFASYKGVHSTEDRSSLNPSNLIRRTSVTVTDFQPNVEIDDSEFTLDSLGLPVGTPVVDKISGTIYRIGSGPESTATPNEPLLEAKSAESIKNQVDTKSIKQDTTDIDEQTEPEKDTTISGEESTQEGIADTLNHQHTQRNVPLIIALFVGIIAVVFIGMKLLLVLKAR